MRFILLFLLLTISTFGFSQGTSCVSPIVLVDGNCFINRTLPGTINMAGTCVGGSNPTIFIRFRAGICSQFTITPNFTLGNPNDQIGYRILTTTCTSVIIGSTNCVGNIVNGESFTINSKNSSGTQLLTSGTEYILQIWGATSTNTFNICYNSNISEEQSNECNGALTLSTTTQSFFNGGDCSYSGSLDDITTSDPSNPNTICAGSLENTQWVRFSPEPGVSSFQISGTNIHCTGGGCGFQFGIFSGNCNSLTNEGCYGNKVCSGGQSTAGPIDIIGGLANITWSNTTTSGFTATFTPTIGTYFTGSEVFYLVMDGNADADCNYDLTGINIITLLDFQLLYFNVRYEYDKILLYWTIQNDNVVDEFSIERSFDGYNFDKISDIDVACFSTERFEYEYLDESLFFDGYVYYRLKWVINNNINYSNVVVVSNKKPNENSVSVYPNPFTDFIKIQNFGNYYGVFDIKIYNTSGKEVLNKSLEFGITNEIEISTKELSPGNYNVIIKSDEDTKMFKIIK